VRLPVIILDSLGNTIEVPLHSLGVDSPSLQPNIVGTVAFHHSVEWKLGNNIEWSVDMESEVFADSLNLRSLCFVKINNIPLLSSASVVLEDTNCLAFFVLSSFNIEDSRILPIDELVVLISEHLEPSGVG
jgi:hypothetical protein